MANLRVENRPGYPVVAGPTGAVVGTTDTQTLLSKRITKRVLVVTQAAIPTFNTDLAEVISITGLAQDITSMTTNQTGAPVAGDTLTVEITDNGTSRAITWGSSFEVGAVPLPAVTSAGVKLRARFVWNSVTSKWMGSEIPVPPRLNGSGSTATPAINTDYCDIYIVSALAVNISGFVVTGTPFAGQRLLIGITGTASRTIVWGSAFEASSLPLPTTTSGTDTLFTEFIYSPFTGKWRVANDNLASIKSYYDSVSTTQTNKTIALGSNTVSGTTAQFNTANSDADFYTTGGADVAVTDGGTGRSTSTTAYGLIAAGTTATGVQQTLAAGATTEVLVGGGAAALPVWTTATGSGAPVRATSPALTTPTGIVKNDVGLGNVDNTSDATKRTPRVTTVTSSATPTFNTDNIDALDITTLTVPITSMTSGRTGTLVNFQRLLVRISSAAAQPIAWGTDYVSGSVALPTTTVAGKILMVGFIVDTAGKLACEASGSRA